MTEWISIDDKNPEFTEWYLCCLSTSYVRMIQTVFYYKNTGFDVPKEISVMGFLITHWAKLPKFPGEKEQNLLDIPGAKEWFERKVTQFVG